MRSSKLWKADDSSGQIRPVYPWIGLVGHDKGDQSAKNRAHRGERPVEQWSLLTQIWKNLTESHSSELVKWHEVKRNEREASRRGFYVPRLKTGMNELLSGAPKNYASRYFQLKVGHGAIGTFLVKTGVRETSECWWCERREQSVEHLCTKCRRWRKQWRKLVRSLSVKSINWQGWTEKKGLASLVADKKSAGTTVGVFKNNRGRRQKSCREERDRMGGTR